jgi:multidrug efflux pump subunit AcrA (membrane-fusion protein)
MHADHSTAGSSSKLGSRAPVMLLAVLVAIAMSLLAPDRAAAAEQLYTCGMHPQIIKKEPGNCPICGMKLTPIRKNEASAPAPSSSGERKVKYYKSTMIPGEVKPVAGKDSMGMDMVPVYEGEDTSGQSNIQIDAATIQRMNLKTGLVQKGPVRREFRTVGSITYNEEGLRDITTKYEGWIEKLHVNKTWASVRAGDPLFDIYSPDLYNAQLNYLVAIRGEKDPKGTLTRAATERLKLFDLPPEFLRTLEEGGEVQRTYTFRAPTDGVVIEKMAVEGQMMRPGERIYRLADLGTLWVEAQIYEKDLAFVSEGQAVTVKTSYGAERELAGVIQVILPRVEDQTRTTTARIVLPNPDGALRPGMFVEVGLATKVADEAVLVPDTAVLRSGERNTVFVALDGGFFEPREIKLGVRSSGNVYQVLSGLQAGERVVTSGQFMLDSESQLREAIQKMLRNTSGEGAQEKAPAAETPPDAAPAAHQHGVVAPSQASPSAAASRSLTPLEVLAFATADAAAALAVDDFSGYAKQHSAMREALKAYFAAEAHAAHGPLGKFQGGLPDTPDLKSARGQFEVFSTVVADLFREKHLQDSTKLHIFECPMAPVTGKARWLQRSAEIQNPFFGTKMPDCGEELTDSADQAKPSAAIAPAAGHAGHSS